MTERHTARDGDTAHVHYTGTLKHGEVFDRSVEGQPLSFTVGSGAMGFDRVVRGLKVGESRMIRIDAADAYGEREKSLVVRVAAAGAPERFSVGDAVRLGDRDAVVTAVTDAHVTVDANHRLAGEALTFEVELVALDEVGNPGKGGCPAAGLRA